MSEGAHESEPKAVAFEGFASEMSPPGAARDWIGLYAAVSAGGVYGFASPFVAPVLVGPLIEVFGIDERTIGILVGLELAGIAVTSTAVAARAARLSLRRVAGGGALLACLGQLASIGAGALIPFGVARFVVGLGEGAVVAAAFAAAANAPKPDRVFAINQVMFSLTLMVLLYMIPQLVELWGYRAGLAALLVVFLTTGPLLLLLPAAPHAASRSETAAPTRALPHVTLGAAALLAYLLVNFSDIGVWVFTERIGTALDLSADRIGSILALASLFNLVGCLAAAILDTRFGRAAPLTAAIPLIAVLTIGLGHAPSERVYVSCSLALAAALLFAYPYLLGALAALDENGSWTALSGSAGAVGLAIGPVVAGYLAAEYSYGTMSWIMGAAAFTALPIMLLVLRRIQPADPRTRDAH